MRGGKLLHSNYTDSHENLIELYSVKDHREGNICRVEFCPEDPRDLDKPDKYKLRIDEERTPDWFDVPAQEKTIKEMRKIITGMIVNKPIDILLGGAYILAEGAWVRFADHARLIMCGGTLTEMWGGTLTEMRGGTLTEMRGGEIVKNKPTKVM